MRVTLRDESRRRIGRIEVDPAARPPRATVEDPVPDGPREVFLHWDSALDDDGNLRRCVHCGCPDLFQEKAFPPGTGAIVALAFAGSALGILGFADRPAVLAAMAAVLTADLAVLLLARRRIVCHRCHSDYRQVAVTRWHPRWDRQVAERYAPSAGPGPADGRRTAGTTPFSARGLGATGR